MGEDTTDVNDAIKSLIDAAKRNGGISGQVFSKIAREYLVTKKLLAHGFEKTTGYKWNDFRVSSGNSQNTLRLAANIAKSRLYKSSNKYKEGYWKYCGANFKVHNQSFVYVGMFKHRQINDYVHEFVKVSSLETIFAEWSIVYRDYPALANLVLSE